MRNRRILAATAACMAALLAAPGVGQEAPKQEAKPWAGPLKPDLPLAKGYDEAARALAMIDDNPLIRWEYRVWCQTGYRRLTDAGTGQPVEMPADMLRDHVSEKGGWHPTGTPEGRLWIDGGARFLDNAWYVGNDATGGVVVKTPDGLLVFDTLREPDEFLTVLKEMVAAGLDPKQIKYIFIGHSHSDHLTGVNAILKVAPNAKVVAGQPDKEIIEEARTSVLAGGPPVQNGGMYARGQAPKDAKAAAALKELRLRAVPERVDIGVPAQPGLKTGTMTIRVGPSTEVVAILAPGHTVGQTHYIVPVQHRGATRKLLVMSGNDQPTEAWQYAISSDYVRSVASYVGADTLINTHGYQSAMFYYLRQLKANPNAYNPFTMGTDGVDRYLGIFADCQRAIHYRLKDGTWLRF